MGYLVNKNGRWVEVSEKEFIVKRGGNWVSVSEDQLTEVEKIFVGPNTIDAINESQKRILRFEKFGIKLYELYLEEQRELMLEHHDEGIVPSYSPYGKFITPKEIEELSEHIESIEEFEYETLQGRPVVKSMGSIKK